MNNVGIAVSQTTLIFAGWNPSHKNGDEWGMAGWFMALLYQHYHLVGGLEHVLLFHPVGNVIIPIDEVILFRGVETTNQNISMI